MNYLIDVDRAVIVDVEPSTAMSGPKIARTSPLNTSAGTKGS